MSKKKELKFKFIGGLGISTDELKKRKSKKIKVNGIEVESAIKEIVDNYYNVGIREFFLGYIPKEWYLNYGFMNSLNGRFGEKEQIEDINILKEAVSYIHTLEDGKGGKCKALLTMNYRYYTAIKMEYIKKVIDETKDFIDGYIVGAIEIYDYLKEVGYKGYISLSTILNIYNEYDNRFYIELCKDYGLTLRRSIFPREMTVKEILDMDKQLVEDNKKYGTNVVTEVFGQGDYCVYANGSCVVGHKMNGSLRDLCSQVFARGQRIIKNIDFDFIDDLLDEDSKKAERIDTELTEEEFLISSDILKYINPHLDILINKIKNKELDEKIVNKYMNKLIIDYKMNKLKYLWDGMTAETDYHNLFINKILNLIDVAKNNYSVSSEILEIEKEIKKVKEKASKHFETLRNNIGKFGAMAKYKFQLYNRTSLPVVHLLTDMKTLDVLKIPMRGRDANSFKLELDKIQDAVNNPEKYIDEGNITGRYFHYDIYNSTAYKKVLNKILSE